ncbi:hypothetical protein TIFTF001_024478 [Ficus carica]|uniref:Uncharacterized protein n=1 Tax=Ficus carica TaxID=3494 RepID=A0AA88DKD6_FICCA|nr:hypothetical protein TIFTF001_024478 [Ficus carica]
MVEVAAELVVVGGDAKRAGACGGVFDKGEGVMEVAAELMVVGGDAGRAGACGGLWIFDGVV